MAWVGAQMKAAKVVLGIAAGLAVAGCVVLPLVALRRSKTVTGYQNGKAVPLTVEDIGGGFYLAEGAAGAWLAMLEAAERAGIKLFVNTAFRANDEQLRLYQLWKDGKGNLAAAPGYSNHQMGLSVDIGGVGSYQSAAYAWLSANARRFGFVNDVSGEYWHWTWKGLLS
jgi:LAS superfamily LD-carboxypeptidase LdcB